MPHISLKHVTKRFGDFVAVDDLNLEIEDRGFVTLLGPRAAVRPPPCG